MTPFTKADIEAAAKAVAAESGCCVDGVCSTCRDRATAALNAAYASAQQRGAAREGRAWVGDEEGGWTADTAEYDPVFDEEFPAVIIKIGE